MSLLRDDAAGPISARRTSQPPSDRRPRVWIVDDSPLQLKLAREALQADFDVAGFESAAAAIEQLALQSSPPDTLVLDWHMPEMGGEEMSRFVRERYDAAQLPILVLTASATREGVLEALAAGANDFVRKPFTDAELVARVGTLARSSQLHARLSEVERTLRVEAEFRERFIGMLAHDLRQPLNTIFMAAQMKDRGAKAATFAEMQLRAAQRMRRMIGELLDFTRNRPETGMPLERRRVDFAELATTSVEEMRVGHAEVDLVLSIEGPCVGEWDADRLAQICSNLVGNAIEHRFADTPVTVTLRGSDREVVLTVSNQGQPIPEAVRASLFQPFRRGQGQKPKGGVGLGLHIVNQIVGSHDGQVWVESDESGTRFSVRLPTGNGAPAPAA